MRNVHTKQGTVTSSPKKKKKKKEQGAVKGWNGASVVRRWSLLRYFEH